MDINSFNGPLYFEKTAHEMLRIIEKSCKVQKALLLKVHGRGFSDGQDYKVSCKDFQIFEELMDHLKPIIVNDLTNDKVLTKDIFRLFSIKAFNFMFIPILKKK